MVNVSSFFHQICIFILRGERRPRDYIYIHIFKLYIYLDLYIYVDGYAALLANIFIYICVFRPFRVCTYIVYVNWLCVDGSKAF